MPINPSPPLPVATPESMGIPSEAIIGLLDGMEDAGIDMHAVAVIRHGRIVARGCWAPYQLQDAVLGYSLSKSFLMCAAGFAVEEGLLDLDAPISEYFPDIESAPGVQRMRVRDILSMTPGYETDFFDPVFGPDPVAGSLAVEPEHEPGTVFTYNQMAPYLLSAAITRQAGLGLSEYLRPRLFDPLGIGQRWWEKSDGIDLGFTGLHLQLDDIIKLGQTYLDGGRFGGEPVLPAGWIDLAAAVHADTGVRGMARDWQQGYGFLLWRSKHGFRSDGAFGQFCLVLPEQDMVVIILSASEDGQCELDVVWEALLPPLARDSLPENALAQQELEQRLATSEIPLAPDSASQPFAAGEMRPDDEGWVVDVDGITFAVGCDDWRKTLVPIDERVLPIAARGQTRDDGGWEATAVITTSPHRLLLSTRPGESAVAARWHTVPLGGQDPRVLAVPCGVVAAD